MTIPPQIASRPASTHAGRARNTEVFTWETPVVVCLRSEPMPTGERRLYARFRARSPQNEGRGQKGKRNANAKSLIFAGGVDRTGLLPMKATREQVTRI